MVRVIRRLLNHRHVCRELLLPFVASVSRGLFDPIGEALRICGKNTSTFFVKLFGVSFRTSVLKGVSLGVYLPLYALHKPSERLFGSLAHHLHRQWLLARLRPP